MGPIARFEILQELGRGSMGAVFRVRDLAEGREVAIKVLRLDAALDPARKTEIERYFERGVQAAMSLKHGNIVACYGRGEFNGYKFAVVELVAGQPLHKLMADGAAVGTCTGRITVDGALEILRQVASGLDYAHAQGMVHGEIRPANILLPFAGGVKISDFGIGRSAAGAPFYLAPEQIEGRALTGRCDQWGLAVTAYELLSGSKPFDSTSIAAVFRKIQTTPPADASVCNPRIPAAASAVLGRALSKSQEDRYNTCGDFVTALSETMRAPQPSAAPSARNIWPAWSGTTDSTPILVGSALAFDPPRGR